MPTPLPLNSPNQGPIPSLSNVDLTSTNIPSIKNLSFRSSGTFSSGNPSVDKLLGSLGTSPKTISSIYDQQLDDRFTNPDIGFSLYGDNEDRYERHQTKSEWVGNTLKQTWGLAKAQFNNVWSETFNGNVLGLNDVSITDPAVVELHRVQEELQKKYPLFKSSQDTWWKNSMNFVGDGLSQFGFTLGTMGALLSQEAIITLSTALAGGSGGVANLPRMFMQAKRAANVFQAFRNTKNILKAARAGKLTLDLPMIKNLVKAGYTTHLAAISEANVEGYDAKLQAETWMRENTNLTEPEIQERSLAVGKQVMQDNYKYLAISNLVPLAQWNPGVRSITSAISKKLLGSAIRPVASGLERAGSTFLGKLSRYGGSALLQSGVEGLEEFNQGVFRTTVLNHFINNFDPEKNANVDATVGEYFENFKKNWSDPESLHEFKIGAFMGLLGAGGAPILKKAADHVAENTKNETLKGLASNFTSDRYRTNQQLSSFNKDLNESGLNMREFINAIYNETKIKESNPEIKNIKDSEERLKLNYFKLLHKNNNYELVLESLDSMKDLSQEDFKALLGFDENQELEKDHLQFVDSMKSQIENYISNVNSTLDFLEKNGMPIPDSIKSKEKTLVNYTPFLKSENKTLRALAESQMDAVYVYASLLSKGKSLEKRYADLNASLEKKFPGMTEVGVHEFFNDERRAARIKEFKDEFISISEMEGGNLILSARKKELQKRVKLLEEVQKELDYLAGDVDEKSTFGIVNLINKIRSGELKPDSGYKTETHSFARMQALRGLFQQYIDLDPGATTDITSIQDSWTDALDAMQIFEEHRSILEMHENMIHPSKFVDFQKYVNTAKQNIQAEAKAAADSKKTQEKSDTKKTSQNTPPKEEQEPVPDTNNKTTVDPNSADPEEILTDEINKVLLTSLGSGKKLTNALSLGYKAVEFKITDRGVENLHDATGRLVFAKDYDPNIEEVQIGDRVVFVLEGKADLTNIDNNAIRAKVFTTVNGKEVEVKGIYLNTVKSLADSRLAEDTENTQGRKQANLDMLTEIRTKMVIQFAKNPKSQFASTITGPVYNEVNFGTLNIATIARPVSENFKDSKIGFTGVDNALTTEELDSNTPVYINDDTELPVGRPFILVRNKVDFNGSSESSDIYVPFFLNQGTLDKDSALHDKITDSFVEYIEKAQLTETGFFASKNLRDFIEAFVFTTAQPGQNLTTRTVLINGQLGESSTDGTVTFKEVDGSLVSFKLGEKVDREALKKHVGKLRFNLSEALLKDTLDFGEFDLDYVKSTYLLTSKAYEHEGHAFSQHTKEFSKPTLIAEPEEVLSAEIESSIEEQQSQEDNIESEVIREVTTRLATLKTKSLIVDPFNSNMYVNSENEEDKYKRVSTVDGKTSDGTTSKEANRGTILDDLLRALILERLSLPDFKERYKLISTDPKKQTQEFDNKFLEQIFIIYTDFINEMESDGFYLLSDTSTLWGELSNLVTGITEKYAGTIDLLAINKKTGEIRIIDLKTSKYNLYQKEDSDPTIVHYINQQSGYAELFTQRTGLPVSGVYLFPIQVILLGDKYIGAIKSVPGVESTMELSRNPKIVPSGSISQERDLQFGSEEEFEDINLLTPNQLKSTTTEVFENTVVEQDAIDTVVGLLLDNESIYNQIFTEQDFTFYRGEKTNKALVLEILQNAYVTLTKNPKVDKVVLDRYKKLIDNYETFYTRASFVIKALQFEEKPLGYFEVSDLAAEVGEEEDAFQQQMNQESSLTTNYLDKMPAEVKKLLFTIPRIINTTNAEGQVVPTYSFNTFGIKQRVDHKALYNKLYQFTTQYYYSPNDSIAAMISDFKASGDPEVVEVANRLERMVNTNKNLSILYKFVTNFNKDYIEYMTLLESVNTVVTDEAGFVTEETVKRTYLSSSNFSSVVQKVKHLFKNSFFRNARASGVLEDIQGDLIINIEKSTEIVNKITEIASDRSNLVKRPQGGTAYTTSALEEIIGLLSQLGIVFESTEVLDSILGKKSASAFSKLFYGASQFSTNFESSTFNFSIFGVLTKPRPENLTEDEIVSHNNIFENASSDVNKLVNKLTKFHTLNHVEGFKQGGKSYYPIIRKSFITDIVKKLKTLFDSSSNIGELFPGFLSNPLWNNNRLFNRNSTSGKPMSFFMEKGVKFNKNEVVELKSQSPLDFELYSLKTFYSTKVPQFVANTYSDKIPKMVFSSVNRLPVPLNATSGIVLDSTMEVVRIGAEQIKRELNRINKVVATSAENSESQHLLFDGYHDKIKNGKLNEGIGKFFIKYFQLNNMQLVEGGFEENPNHIEFLNSLDPLDLDSYLREYVIVLFQELASSTLQDWTELGLRGGLSAREFLQGTSLMDNWSKFGGKLNLISNVEDIELRHNLAFENIAAEYSINHFLFSNDMIDLTGDPAWTSKLSLRREQDGSLDFGSLKSSIEKTALEFAKRNASFMASGDVGVYYKPNYNVAVANDLDINSDQFSLYQLLLSTESKVNYNTGKKTDAQEIITVKEALDRMAGEGFITPEQYVYMLNKFAPRHFQQLIEPTNVDSLQNHPYVKHIVGNSEVLDRVLNTPYEDSIFYTTFLNVQKPVQRETIYSEDIDTHYELYIKSSAVPLIESLTSGTWMDNLLDDMYSKNVQRVAFKSAVKSGSRNSQNILENDGYNPNFLENNIQSVPASAYRKQVDTIYEPNKKEVTQSTQDYQLFTSDVLPGYSYMINGERISGDSLQKKLKSLTDNIFDIKFNKYLNKIGVNRIEDENGVRFEFADLTKLSKFLIEEFTKENNGVVDPTIAKQLSINPVTGQFEVPLSFYSGSQNIQSKIMSVATKSFIKSKMSGRSVIQTSEVILPVLDKDSVTSELSGGVVWTSEEYRGKTSLNFVRLKNKETGEIISLTPKTDGKGKATYVKGVPQFEETNSVEDINDLISVLIRAEQDSENDTTLQEDIERVYNKFEILPAEIVVPFPFVSGKNDKLFDSLVEGDLLKEGSIDPELLELYGLRIPYQGVNSGMWFKIVGFTPRVMGEAAIVPAEIAAQMGSDYDVDKLFLYIKNYRLSNYSEEDRALIDELNEKFEQTLSEYKDVYSRFVTKRSEPVFNTEGTLIDQLQVYNDSLGENGYDIDLSEYTPARLKKIYVEENRTEEEYEVYNLYAAFLEERMEFFSSLDEYQDDLNQVKEVQQDLIESIAEVNSRKSPRLLKYKVANGKTSVKSIQNEIIEMHKGVYTSLFSLREVLEPQETPDVDNVIADLENRAITGSSLIPINWMGIASPQFQRNLYFSNRVGQELLGISVVSSLLHSSLQQTNSFLEKPLQFILIGKNSVHKENINENKVTKYTVKKEGNIRKRDESEVYKYENKEVSVNMKDSLGFWRLDKVFNVAGRKISNAFKQLISITVDNSKDQKVARIGLNPLNINVSTTLLHMGLDIKHMAVFINQPILKAFYDFCSGQSLYSDFTGNVKKQGLAKFLNYLLTTHGNLLGDIQITDLEKLLSNASLEVIDFNDLYKSLSSDFTQDVKTLNTQLKVLGIFMHLDGVASDISDIQSNIDTFRKGFAKNFIENNIKAENIREFLGMSDSSEEDIIKPSTSSIKNFGKNISRIIPFKHMTGPLIMEEIFSDGYVKGVYTPLIATNTPAYRKVLQTLAALKGSKLTVEETDLVNNEIKRFLLTHPNFNLYSVNGTPVNIEDIRKEILEDDGNIFDLFNEIQDTFRGNKDKGFMRNNLFKFLNKELDNSGKNPKLTIPLDLDVNDYLDIRKDWIKLLNYDTNNSKLNSSQKNKVTLLNKFANMLIYYTVLSNSNEFGYGSLLRLMPYEILEAYGYGSLFTNINSNLSNQDFLTHFIPQFLSHEQGSKFVKSVKLYRKVNNRFVFNGTNVITEDGIITSFSPDSSLKENGLYPTYISYNFKKGRKVTKVIYKLANDVVATYVKVDFRGDLTHSAYDFSNKNTVNSTGTRDKLMGSPHEILKNSGHDFIKEVYNTLDPEKLPKYSVEIDNSIPGNGRTVGNKISLNFNNIQLAANVAGTSFQEELERVLFHEVLHVLFNTLDKNSNEYKQIKGVWDSYRRQALQLEPGRVRGLNESAIKALLLKYIHSDYKQYRKEDPTMSRLPSQEYLEDNWENLKEFFQREINALKKEGVIDSSAPFVFYESQENEVKEYILNFFSNPSNAAMQDWKNKYYAFISLDEFVSESMSNKVTRQYLNTMESNGFSLSELLSKIWTNVLNLFKKSKRTLLHDSVESVLSGLTKYTTPHTISNNMNSTKIVEGDIKISTKPNFKRNHSDQIFVGSSLIIGDNEFNTPSSLTKFKQWLAVDTNFKALLDSQDISNLSIFANESKIEFAQALKEVIENRVPETDTQAETSESSQSEFIPGLETPSDFPFGGDFTIGDPENKLEDIIITTDDINNCK